MYKLKKNPIGIYEKAIPDFYDWSDKIDIAKAAGYDYIEMSVDESDERLARLAWSKRTRQDFVNLLKEKEFYINSMCLSGHRRFPFGSKDKDKKEMAYKIMDAAIEFAKDLGISNIQLAGYDVYYEEADDQTKKDFIEGLKYAAKKAAAASIMLSIEIMDTEFIGTISRCMEYIRLVNSPWLNIYPDLGNLSQWTDDTLSEIKLGFPHIVAIHLKDTKPGVFKCVPFGEGTVVFEPMLALLKELDYTGPFMVEMWADNEVFTSKEDCIKEIAEAKEWLSARSGGLF